MSKKQCDDNYNLSTVDSHQSKKLSPAHSSNISVKSTKRIIHMSQNCAITLPTVHISISDSHDTCIQRITDIRCENLSAQQSAQQHNVPTDCSEHFTDEPGKAVKNDEICLKPGCRHSKTVTTP